MRALLPVAVVLAFGGCLAEDAARAADAEVHVTTRYDPALTDAEDSHGAPATGAGAAGGVVFVHWTTPAGLDEWRELRDSGLFDPVAPLEHRAGERVVDNETNRARLHSFPLDSQGRVSLVLATERDLVLSFTPEGAGGERNGCEVRYENWGERDRRWVEEELEPETSATVPFGVDCSE